MHDDNDDDDVIIIIVASRLIGHRRRHHGRLLVAGDRKNPKCVLWRGIASCSGIVRQKGERAQIHVIRVKHTCVKKPYTKTCVKEKNGRKRRKIRSFAQICHVHVFYLANGTSHQTCVRTEKRSLERGYRRTCVLRERCRMLCKLQGYTFIHALFHDEIRFFFS